MFVFHERPEEEEVQGRHMEELPYELLLEIFDYLSVSELGIASSVSRSWNELCSHQTLWKSRYLHALGTELINDPFSSYYGVLSPTIQPEEGYKKFLQKKLVNNFPFY